MTTYAPIQLTEEQITWLRSVQMSKRAAVVRDHILEHGAVTTQTLAEKYGYDHPPRAKRDLIDAGVGVATRMVLVNGRRMAEYYFTGAANEDAAGRVVIPKAFADKLKAANDFKCVVCNGTFAGRQLQADHRIPFAIAGDKAEMHQEDFMPLCASDNRAKSWSCEHCPNWIIRDPEICKSCFWHDPKNYTHVETRPERRLVLTFQGYEVVSYDQLKRSADTISTSVEQLVKDVLASEADNSASEFTSEVVVRHH